MNKGCRGLTRQMSCFPGHEISLVDETKLKGLVSHIFSFNGHLLYQENDSDCVIPSPPRGSALYPLNHMVALLHHL